MANGAASSHGAASFLTQANALLRKNLTFQKRNMGTNIRLVSFPILFCLLLFTLQTLVNNVHNEQPKVECTCSCDDIYGDGKCKQVCVPKKSDNESHTTQTSVCPIPSPMEFPPLLQIPLPENSAVSTDLYPSTDFPNKSCRATHSCPVIALFTGNNQSLGESLAQNMFTSSFINASTFMDTLAINAMGSLSEPYLDNFFDFAAYNLSSVQSKCPPNSPLNVSAPSGNQSSPWHQGCVEGLLLWRNSSIEINNVLYKSYWKGNSERKVNEIFAAYDFLDSDAKHLNVNVWYNSTNIRKVGWPFLNLVRVPRALSLVSSAYIHHLRGPETRILLEFVKEMPSLPTYSRLDIASPLATLLFSWVILQLFPVILGSLMYEKQQNLRIMMKMHGLGDGPYWLISYAYFLCISSVYMLCFIIFGSVLGLKFFTLNAYSIQVLFYFIYINLQISMAFLVAAMFSNVRTATVIGYMGVFGTGLLGEFLFKYFIEAASFPRGWIIVMELYPGFSLYRGLYEFGQSSNSGNYSRTEGLVWGDLNDRQNGLREVMIIMFVEWWILMFAAYYIDQVVSAGNGVRRSPLFFLQRFQEKRKSSRTRASLRRHGSKSLDQMDKADVLQEVEKVEQLLLERDLDHAIISDNLKKIYPGRDGNPEKIAVRGMSLALPLGECFGLLGPNGAGKTSFINMMIGLTNPTSGKAYVHGLDIQREMGSIYTSMGVCPQYDLMWETLTGREHLLFYGRLKNLKGTALTQAVEESLRSVNLFHGGVSDKKAGEYSGGMKRRLSVAISLIGDPKVVYMDEPGTGLDPASRKNLWSVVKRAKHNRAIILTTHSMEEAEVLCDRLGIFVDGSLQCIGNPKELKGRYGGSYVLTMTTSAIHEEEVENLVNQLSPGAKKVYQISGTQKFEMPKQDVRIADVFRAVEYAKSCFGVQAWGLADATLEDVFIKVACGTQTTEILS